MMGDREQLLNLLSSYYFKGKWPALHFPCYKWLRGIGAGWRTSHYRAQAAALASPSPSNSAAHRVLPMASGPQTAGQWLVITAINLKDGALVLKLLWNKYHGVSWLTFLHYINLPFLSKHSKRK